MNPDVADMNGKTSKFDDFWTSKLMVFDCDIVAEHGKRGGLSTDLLRVNRSGRLVKPSAGARREAPPGGAAF